MVVVKDRTAATCVSVVKKHVKRGSIVHSDMWKAHNPVEKMGMDHKHRKACHKKEFVNTTDGFRTNTQMVEGTWGAQKKSIPMSTSASTQAQNSALQCPTGTWTNLFSCLTESIHCWNTASQRMLCGAWQLANEGPVGVNQQQGFACTVPRFPPGFSPK